MRIPISACAALFLALPLSMRPVPGAAQEREPAAEARGVAVFEASDFSAAAPANAYDMVTRLPGFTIVDADADVRGYAGARGNVLIDGAQPASKRESVDGLLRRIPAAAVERIELVRGGARGIDMGGYAVIANVVRRREAAAEMALQAGVAVAADGWSGSLGQFEYGRRRGDEALEFAVSVEPELDEDTGRGRILAFAPDGALVEALDTDTRRVDREFTSNVSWRRTLSGGSFSLNAALRGKSVDEAMERLTQGAGTPVETAYDTEDMKELEVGGRFVRPLGDRSTLELMASQRLDRLDALSLSREEDEEERFEEKTETGETLLRVDVGRAHSDQLRLSVALEGAFNFLESQARLSENGERIELPGSDVRIEERRMEAASAAVWRPHADWSIEGGMRVETSALRQSGDTPMERDFVYLKPRLAAYWERDDRDSFHLGLSREVGQLDFEDFVASAALDTGAVSAGNAELEPDKTWRLVAGWERRFRDDGALGMTWTHERIADVVDRVLVASGDDVFDAPGNIGEGRRDTFEIEFSASLDGIGMAGFRFSSVVLWRSSSVTDPATGDRRGISGEPPVEGRIRLMQTVPAYRIAWGLGVDLAERETKYRYDEVKIEREALSWNLFAERRIGAGWRLRAEAMDLFGRRFSESRSKYDGPRSQVPLDERKYRMHRTPGQLLVTVRRNTGD